MSRPVQEYNPNHHKPGTWGAQGLCAYCAGMLKEERALYEIVVTRPEWKKVHYIAVCAKHAGRSV